eukprot:COSAG06_NODE_1132_length_10582_cov_5.539826_16_plen_56_part_00
MVTQDGLGRDRACVATLPGYALRYVAPPCASAKRLFKGLLNPRFAQRSASRLSSA